jgi:predicted transcriptional regulator of viral defense system
MEFNALLQLVGDDPVFESSLLLAGDIDPRIVQLQLSRWVNNERIHQLRRGLYAIAPPYQKVRPHPFLVANRLQRASYVSLQSALAFYGIIPEIVNVIGSVTAGRPGRLETPLGVFDFRHIQPRLLCGYEMVDLGGQTALLATPEKALLDLVYLQPGGGTAGHLGGLRLQNLDRLDPQRLKEQAGVFDSPKIRAAARNILQLIGEEAGNLEEL